MIRRSGIVFSRLPDEEFDRDLMGDASGAGVIFGVTGGVMEAALRTAYFVLEGKEHEPVEFTAVRGFEGVREASFTLGGETLRVAVASGMKNAKRLLDEIRAGESPYHFIEIMCCPGGCINGAGQPYAAPERKKARGKELYSSDKLCTMKRSEENMLMMSLYSGVLKGKVHELLHVDYVKAKEK